MKKRDTKRHSSWSLTSGFRLLTSMTQWPAGSVGNPSLPAAAAAAAALGMAKEARAPGTPGMVRPEKAKKIIITSYMVHKSTPAFTVGQVN